jgi:rRNA maturation endonuclease Nob1
MIPVSLTTLLIIGLAVGVLLLGLLWLLAVTSQRRHEKKVQQFLVQCRICGNIYDNPDKKTMSACPSCGSLNEATHTRAI